MIVYCFFSILPTTKLNVLKRLSIPIKIICSLQSNACQFDTSIKWVEINEPYLDNNQHNIQAMMNKRMSSSVS
jgi:hypothetical protein